MTRVGRCTFSINHAAVADLPVPVAPIRTTSRSPLSRRSDSSAIACGWSPEGSNSLMTSKFPSARSTSPTGRNSECARTGCSAANAIVPSVAKAVLKAAGYVTSWGFGLSRARVQSLGAAVEFRTNIKIGTDLDKAGIKSLPGQQRRVPLHQLALSAHGLTPGEAQAVLSMVRGCGCEAARLQGCGGLGYPHPESCPQIGRGASLTENPLGRKSLESRPWEVSPRPSCVHSASERK